MKHYKFMYQDGKKLRAQHGKERFVIGEWLHKDGKPVLCENGYHSSRKIYHAFSYVQGDVLAIVEVKGKSDTSDDKDCHTDMRVVEAYKWTRKDSVALSIFAAELCLNEFERLFPEDKRPRQAIEAAKAVLLNDTEQNRSAAESAESAAWSAAESAESAAWSAAWSAAESAESAAWSAAESAWSAAWSAAESAESAARAAARAAAESAAINKIEKWLKNHVKEMEKL